MNLRAILLAGLLLPSLALAGCVGGEGGEGRFVLFVTDQPNAIDDFSSLTVTVDRIVIATGDNETQTLEPAEPTFDLTQLLEGNTSTLFNGTVPTGEYTRLDLYVSEATGVLRADGSTVDVGAPSGRIFLNTAFTISEDETTTFLFDVQVIRLGNGEYQLKPNADGSGPDKGPGANAAGGRPDGAGSA